MIKRAKAEDAAVLAALAMQMWTEHEPAELEEEFRSLILSRDAACFLKIVNGSPIAFAQCQLRHDYVEGTARSPVGYLEGVFVSEAYRRKGYAAELLTACEQWAKEQGCTEFASDCEPDNADSLRFHLATGFSEANRIICFTKTLQTPDAHPYTIRLETEQDYRAVEELTREAFWNVYKPGADEHYYVHQMRSHPDFIPELAFVLERDGRIVGNIMYTKAWLEDENGERKEIVSFGPLCVAPDLQRQKLGKILIEHSFAAARKMGYDVNINFGNPGNYVSRGFVSCKKKNVCCFAKGNYPTALLVCELVPGALDGRAWMFIPSTAADCCEDTAAVEAFDATFPPKEKKWMPSQEEFYIYRNSSVVR